MNLLFGSRILFFECKQQRIKYYRKFSARCENNPSIDYDFFIFLVSFVWFDGVWRTG